MRNPTGDSSRQCGEETFVFSARALKDDGSMFLINDGREISVVDRATLTSLLRQQLRGH